MVVSTINALIVRVFGASSYDRDAVMVGGLGKALAFRKVKSITCDTYTSHNVLPRVHKVAGGSFSLIT